MVSDDAAVYQRFNKAQKCWAHLIREAIRPTLLFPENDEYQAFLDGLLAVFYRAKQVAADSGFSGAGRTAEISELENQLGMTAEKNMMPIQPGDVAATWADTSGLETDFDYHPGTPISEGIKAFVEWYKEFYKIGENA